MNTLFSLTSKNSAWVDFRLNLAHIIPLSWNILTAYEINACLNLGHIIPLSWNILTAYEINACLNLGYIIPLSWNILTTYEIEVIFWTVIAKQVTMSSLAEVIPPACLIILHLQYNRFLWHCKWRGTWTAMHDRFLTLYCYNKKYNNNNSNNVIIITINKIPAMNTNYANK